MRLLCRTALRWLTPAFACVPVSAAGCGAPGSEGAQPTGAGCVSGPPRVNQSAAQTHCRPNTLQHTGLDQWVLHCGFTFHVLRLQREQQTLLNVNVCFSFAGGGEHRGSWACSAGASVQRFQACHWETGGHPRTAQQTTTGNTASQWVIWFKKCSALGLTVYLLQREPHQMLSNSSKAFVKAVWEVTWFCRSLPGTGLLRGDEVGVHQLGWVCFIFSTTVIEQLQLQQLSLSRLWEMWQEDFKMWPAIESLSVMFSWFLVFGLCCFHKSTRSAVMTTFNSIKFG